MSLNKVLLIGNVGKNPEIRNTSDNRKIATFTIATSERWRDKSNGEMREKTEWHRVVILSDGLVGIIEKYVKKGSKLYIEGTLQTRKWTDSGGVERYVTEVVLQGYNNKLEIVSASGSSGNGGDDSGGGYSSSSSGDDHYSSDINIDDDVPF
jgi:single-strand DNA-binding protein